MSRRGVQSLWPEAEGYILSLPIEKRIVYESARKKALLDSVMHRGPTKFTQEEIAVLDEVARVPLPVSRKEMEPRV